MNPPHRNSAATNVTRGDQTARPPLFFPGSLRGRLLLLYSVGILCFIGVLVFDALQFRDVAAAFRCVNEVYIPLTRTLAKMSGGLERPDGLGLLITDARDVLARGDALPLQDEERAAMKAVARELDALERAATTSTEVRQDLRRLSDLVDTRIKIVSDRAGRAQEQAIRFSVGLVLMAVGVGGVLLWLTGRTLEPVRVLTAQVERMAAGLTPEPVAAGGQDEIATLARAFDQMVETVASRDRSLQALSLYLRQVLDRIGQAVAVVEAGQVRMANPSARALWGAVEGAPLPTSLAVLDEGRHEAVDFGSSTHEITVQPFGVGHIFVGEDVTERLRVRARLQRSERLALVGQMLAQVNHEVRNPLNAISLHVELLSEEVHTEEGKELLATVMQEIRRLEGVTENYLELVRRRPTERVLTDPVELARRVVGLEAEKLRRSGVHVEVEGSVAPVEMDSGGLRQVLLNLLRNAVEAGATRVRVLLQPAPHALEVIVEDNGPGMDPHIADRVFEPFYSTRARGTGLGLSICRQIVEEFGGTIRVETQPGHGARFFIEVPV